MALDAFLKISTIDGESTKKGFEKQIELESFSWAVHQTTTMHSGTTGGSAGKAIVNDISFSKKVDKTSPILLQNCLMGTHYKEIILSLRKVTGGVQMPFLIFTMNDCILSSYSTGGSHHSEELSESMSINFARIKMEYVVQDAKGQATGKTTASWDITTGTKIGA